MTTPPTNEAKEPMSNPTPSKPDELLDEINEMIDNLVEEDCREDTDSRGEVCNVVTELFVADLKAHIQTHYIRRDEVLALLPSDKNKNPSGYVNEGNLRAWQAGYNKALKDMKSALQPDIREDDV